jgi:hypothetical protein
MQQAAVVPDDGITALPVMLVYSWSLAGLVDEFREEPV